MYTMRKRRGVTLVEVVVLIVIAMVLGFLLLAFLAPVHRGGSREAARRNQCMNKMKLLGMALQNYHDTFKKFPATSSQGNEEGTASVWWPAPGSGAATGAIPSIGYTSDAGTTSATAGYSWIVKILPYMDETALYTAIKEASGKFSADAFTPYDVAGNSEGNPPGRNFWISTTSGGKTIHRHFAAVVLDEVSCPSYAGLAQVEASRYSGTPAGDSLVAYGNPPAAYGFPSGSSRLGSPPQLAAITNYVALSATHFPLMQYGAGPKLAATTEIPTGAEAPNGMIVPGTGLNVKACTDGASHTLMLCETVEPAMNCWYDGTTTWTTGINPNTVSGYPPSKADPTPWGKPNPREYWKVPAGGTTALQVGPLPDAATIYSPALAGYGEAPEMISWGPSSNHAGIVVHGAVDGSVHLITPDIDPTVYMHLITIAGGEKDAIPGMGP